MEIINVIPRNGLTIAIVAAVEMLILYWFRWK
jgi:hypothetical protein